MDEDIRPVVIDTGSGAWKIGFGGEARPREIMPPIAIRERYTNQPRMRRCGHEAIQILSQLCGLASTSAELSSTLVVHPTNQEGRLCSNWDDYELLFSQAFYQCLMVPPEEQPVLLSGALFAPRSQTEKVTQICFETFNTPAIYVAVDALLDYHCEYVAPTVLVVDVGHQHTSVVPVEDGSFVDREKCVRSDLGGEAVSSALKQVLQADYAFNIAHPVSDYYVASLKDNISFVALCYDEEVSRYKNRSFHGGSPASMSSELRHIRSLPYMNAKIPILDHRITLGQARFECMERLLNPKAYNCLENSIQASIMECVNKHDADLQHTLLSNVLLVGGPTTAPGFVERLRLELSRLSPIMPNIIAPPSREFATWLGGSLLSVQPEFQMMWISKEEYDESGPGYRSHRPF